VAKVVAHGTGIVKVVFSSQAHTKYADEQVLLEHTMHVSASSAVGPMSSTPPSLNAQGSAARVGLIEVALSLVQMN
jgi:hypothetical protein